MKHSFCAVRGDFSIRPLAYNDIEQLRVWRNDSSNSKYLRKIPYIDAAAQNAWFESYLANDSEVCFAADYQGSLVGSASLYHIKRDQAEFGRIMIGSSEFKGKGLGFRLSELTVGVGFDQMGFERIEASVAIDNIAALFIYVRLGFCISGRVFNEESGHDEFELIIEPKRFFSLNE